MSGNALVPSQEPKYSPDGMWVWDGCAWRPAPPHPSADGEWLWTGSHWEASRERRRSNGLLIAAAIASLVAMIAAMGAVMTAADTPADMREGLTLATVLMIGIFSLPAVALGATTFAVSRGRLLGRVGGLLAAVIGLLCGALEVMVFSA